MHELVVLIGVMVATTAVLIGLVSVFSVWLRRRDEL